MVPGSWRLQAYGYEDKAAMSRQLRAHLCPAAVNGLQPEARPCPFLSIEPAPSHSSVPPPPTLRKVLATALGLEVGKENNNCRVRLCVACV